MHELGIIIEVVQTVERIAREQNLTQIQRLTLQIGELSSVIPYFVEQCYPAAVDGTMLLHFFCTTNPFALMASFL